MRYTIWRQAPGGESFPITSSGNTTIKEIALEKAANLNARLIGSDPDTEERFVVKDDNGREIKPQVSKPAVVEPELEDEIAVAEEPVVEKASKKKPSTRSKAKAKVKTAKKKAAPKKKVSR